VELRSLDGDGWQVRGCLGDEWRWHVRPEKPWNAPGWLPARVPGSVLDDLWRAGRVADPYHERNSLLLEWVPERALVDEEHRWPADRTNPVYEHLGAWWNNAPLVQQAFGGRIEEVDTLRRASQWLQYEGLRYAVEGNRRRLTGSIPWQVNESYPNAWCTAAIDHHGDPKPAYYGVARAYRSDHVSARFATCAWGGRNEARAHVAGAARFIDIDGRVVAETPGGEIVAPLDAFATDVFLLDLDANRYVMTRTDSLAPLLDLPPAAVEARREGTTLHLRHLGGPAAIGMVVEDARRYEAPGWVVFSDNVIDLLPGESRTIEVHGAGELLVEGWNVEALRVG
jgi:beta-mannosidase